MSTIQNIREIEKECEECEENCSRCLLFPARIKLRENLKNEMCAKCKKDAEWCPIFSGHHCMDEIEY